MSEPMLSFKHKKIKAVTTQLANQKLPLQGAGGLAT
jgi:hypothetical protein